MSNVLEAVPQAEAVKTGVTGAKAVANGLSEALADTYRLVFKTHAYHWNVEGPLFFSIHMLTDTQYADMFAAADVIAERIRALGQLTPFRMADVMSASVVEDPKTLPNAVAIVEDLARDHAAVSKRMHGLIELANTHNDPVTADLITGRCAFHEKAAWMLRAQAK